MDEDNVFDESVGEQADKETRAELELDWEALAVAFENQLPESHSFLDLRTGKVHTTVSDPHTIPDPPGTPEDYLYIRPRPSREGYRTMQRFIEEVQEASLREKLAAALVGKGAFRRFKDQLLAYPEIRQQWFAFKDSEVYNYARDWLEREGVKATNDFPAAPSNGRLATSPARSSPAVLSLRAPEHRRDMVSHVGAYSLPEEDADWREAIGEFDRREVVFRPQRSALLVIDMQRVFVDPDGDTYLPMSRGACERLERLVAACREARVPVIFTRHIHVDPKQDGGSMARWWNGLILEGTEGAELAETMQPMDGERVITKCRYSAFAGTPLEMILHSMGVEDLIIGGVMTNLCCETTARDAFVRDFNVFFLADGTAAADEALHHASLKNIAYGFGRVMGVSEAMETLGATSLKNG